MNYIFLNDRQQDWVVEKRCLNLIASDNLNPSFISHNKINNSMIQDF